MYKNDVYKVMSNRCLAPGVYEMRLSGSTEYITAPGQFINIRLDGRFLRRPISVCDVFSGGIVIIYKVVGEGTEYMSMLGRGAELDCLTGLGNGYDISKSKKPLVIGGGVGVPPMYYLTKQLIAAGQQPTVILGFNKKEEIFVFYSRKICIWIVYS